MGRGLCGPPGYQCGTLHVCEMCVPSDALEQVLHSARGLNANQTGRADISIYCFLGPKHINCFKCPT